MCRYPGPLDVAATAPERVQGRIELGLRSRARGASDSEGFSRAAFPEGLWLRRFPASRPPGPGW